MKGYGKFLLICVVLLSWSGLGSAATQVVNCPAVSSSTEFNGNIVCAQFDPTTGTLQSIQITVTGTITGTVTLTNDASTSQTLSGTVNSQFNAGALAGFTVVNPIFTASYGTGNQTLSAGQTAIFSGLSGSGSGNLGTNSSSLAAYTGAGTFNIPVTTVTGFTALMGGANFHASQTTNASASAVVTYTYRPVVNCTTVSSPTELNANIVCAQFNPQTGTLQSVQIVVTGTITGTITLANHASTSQTASGTVNSQFNLGAIPGMTISNPVFTDSYGTGTQTLSAGQTAVFSGLSGSGSVTLSTSSNLGAYTGTGTFSIPVSTTSRATVLGGGGQISSSGSTSAQATAVVTYY